MTHYCPICKSTHNIWHHVKNNEWYCGKCGFFVERIPMKKFILIQRDFSVDDLKVDIVEAKDSDTAWEEAEMKYGNSDTQTWILTLQQAKSLTLKLMKAL